LNKAYSAKLKKSSMSKSPTTLKKPAKLLEAGFEYVTDIDGAKVFRKRK